MSQSLHTQTTSVDSIGSCSLDVNATGTTTPATMVLDGSEHSLRSVSLEHKLSEVGDSDVVTPTRPILRPQPFTDPGPPPRDSFKTPSYLGISCAVNGYNRLNRYDSTLREGFRSRDASPARLAFSRSRDSSPMRPEWKGFDYRTKVSPQATAAKIKELKEELARFKEEFPHPPGERGRQNISKRLGRRPSQGRSISVDRGYLTKSTSQGTMNGLDTPIASPGRMVEITMTDKSSIKSSSYQYSYEERTVRSNGSETTSTYTCTTHANGDTPDKSFIQSRIERLYGPGALGSGFRSRRSLLELEKEQKDREAAGHRSPLIAPHSDSHYDPDAQAPEGFPSVFRHLRPEFRTQLQVKRNTGTPKICLSPQPLSPSQVESPKRPGRVIPITLTDTCERKPSKPPVTPKPELPISNDVQRSNSKPMVVQKIVNGNGNIEEIEVTVDKEPSVNGSVEHKVSEDKVIEDSTNRTSKVNGVPESVKVNGIVSEEAVEQKDGHYFLKIVDEVIREIEQKVAQIESYLEASGSEMSEEVKGKVLAAVGKAKLLVSQKIQQFQGLCHKNINTSADEEFPTTCEDLAGFWDMVSIQVEDIRQSLKEIETLRSNNWQERVDTDTIDGAEVMVSTGKARRKPAPRPSRPARSTRAGVEKTEEGKTRDEARRKMIEERRKAMKEAMKAKKAEAEAKKGEDAVEIFIPEGK
ncbi:Disks large-associated protein 4 [Portunus trituberculatus]|uniref:Disks large-associated protein 4 n=2 Tax=Portunus trituberculatus TaxID=210409 RepID=A0A5B7D0M5_PORTR|nr:Disks large-associated protein 4 [Portunus trituberculatus]